LRHNDGFLWNWLAQAAILSVFADPLEGEKCSRVTDSQERFGRELRQLRELARLESFEAPNSRNWRNSRLNLLREIRDSGRPALKRLSPICLGYNV
jgi:hypothetical protein